ncbi:MAG: DUF1616 domain-containing protein [Nitrososphaerota archaeon]|jgi:uncharacterized membrane protein|nr:DUF1616 domain-containing protein [Nitrososphaerota archaeon]MDG6961855.1 DUF1616 domain-containing protein [Nitrososphaerota archaeon]MDG6962522.1 DUF1616 domain-containing protein [Nitrososphaerota archaeon]MDG6971204.1 DUF1616 domain-containing protein [Nitrososphaerota archaeon]MDG6980675.1 DUF1616 domain-containing protein [Nitrososphaerota archaeon]
MIDDDLKVAAVGVIVLIAVFNVSGYYFANRNVEPFSELGILGPTQKIADYPSSVLTGQNFSLNLYVGNHEGQVSYYQVLTKLGTSANANQSVPLAAPVMTSYGMVLLNNRNVTEPITLSLDHNGTNVRLVFELWIYETNTTSFRFYTSDWLYLNVTGPSA